MLEDLTRRAPPRVQVSTFLAEALTGLRTLGPRLAHLGLDLIMKVGAADLHDPDPATELLARCKQVDLERMLIAEPGSVEAVLEAARCYGLPQWVEYRELRVRLRKGDAPRPSPHAPAPGPLPPPMPLPALVERAVKRMASAPVSDSSWGPVGLLLRGSAVRVLLAVPAALHAWAQQLAKEVAASGPGPGAAGRLQVSGYRSLPTAGAVVLECGSGPGGRAAAEAAAEVARQLAGAGGDGGSAPGGSAEASAAPAACVLEAIQMGRRIDAALMEVLQALWDGAEEGGPGPATGSREGELARLRWLLESWERLRGLPGRMVLEEGE
ncbi:hypothetical protein HYH03_010090 [Edaphochlamys debaryana]|uniref:Uncharacterized protein n=1 Tax=Edaphochlamys debaryana TaxID=47281 RepID=A0A835XYS6_9CHLO|nr:hypothetical protein HYH03_010090 [Edaphochlamys debaryana]|eukprot:KAG2491513.1 hypothetical protein HYH03_010090 [Edaphochlamys debaryana]